MSDRRIRGIVLLMCTACLLACQLTGAPTSTPTPLAPSPTAWPTVSGALTATPTLSLAPSTSTPVPSSTPASTSTSTPAPLDPTRIRFASGAISAQVSGHLEAAQSHTYVLAASGGQTMMARLLGPATEDPAAILIIWGSDGAVLISDHALAVTWEGLLPSTQDYFIDVKANPDTSCDYTLEIVIPPLSTATPESSEPTRLRFESGATSVRVTGHLDASASRSFVIRALAGQTMSVRLLPPPAGEPEVIFTIHGADGTVMISDHALATSWDGVLPVTQDYVIDVRAHPSSAVDFTLEVVIPPLGSPTPSDTATRIRFAPGATSAQVDAHLEASRSHSYVLGALAGQHLWASILPPSVGEPKAILIIWGADGTVLLTDHAGATTWDGVLPETQDYFIDVHANPTSAVDYTLEVIILTP